MSDILETLKLYLSDPTVVMSRRVVDYIIEEIERLRAEHAAATAKLTPRDGKTVLVESIRECTRLRAELAAARNEHENLLLMWRNETAEIEKALTVVEAERDELRDLLREAREYVADMPIVGDELLARIDAALNKGESSAD